MFVIFVLIIFPWLSGSVRWGLENKFYLIILNLHVISITFPQLFSKTDIYIVGRKTKNLKTCFVCINLFGYVFRQSYTYK